MLYRGLGIYSIRRVGANWDNFNSSLKGKHIGACFNELSKDPLVDNENVEHLTPAEDVMPVTILSPLSLQSQKEYRPERVQLGHYFSGS